MRVAFSPKLSPIVRVMWQAKSIHRMLISFLIPRFALWKWGFGRLRFLKVYWSLYITKLPSKYYFWWQISLASWPVLKEILRRATTKTKVAWSDTCSGKVSPHFCALRCCKAQDHLICTGLMCGCNFQENDSMAKQPKLIMSRQRDRPIAKPRANSSIYSPKSTVGSANWCLGISLSLWGTLMVCLYL